MNATQIAGSISTGLLKVMERAKRDPEVRFLSVGASHRRRCADPRLPPDTKECGTGVGWHH